MTIVKHTPHFKEIWTIGKYYLAGQTFPKLVSKFACSRDGRNVPFLGVSRDQDLINLHGLEGGLGSPVLQGVTPMMMSSQRNILANICHVSVALTAARDSPSENIVT